MAGTAQEQRHVVSPLERPRHKAGPLLSHGLLDPPATREGSQSKDAQIANSVSGRTSISKNWQPPTTKRSKNSTHYWPWEWLCELLAVASLGATVILLWYYQGRPQAEWQQSYFTLNGLVAFLATLTKTGLIVPVSASISQQKWLRFLPGKKKVQKARRLGDFELFDEASRGSLGSIKLVFSLDAW